MSVEVYSEGKNLQAGLISTDQIPLAAGTYHVGMLLEYLAEGTAETTGDGNGVASAITAGPSIKPGVYTCLFTAALVCDLKDSDGNILATGLTVPDGGAAAFDINSLKFTLTDGSTPWSIGDSIAITVAVGNHIALADGELAAIYNGHDERVLATAGVDDCIVWGDVYKQGIVDSAGDALALTEYQIAAFRKAGFYMKEA